MISTMALVLLGMGSASALTVGAHAVRSPTSYRAARVLLSDDAASKDCSVIELRTDDPVILAKVLRKAWMEGGMKRGLTGAVVVPDEEGMVQIIAQGPLERVRSFGDWCGKQLDIEKGLVEVKEMDLEACPAIPLSSKFELADMPRGKANAPWCDLLQKSYDDTSAAATKLHSSDEGLA